MSELPFAAPDKDCSTSWCSSGSRKSSLNHSVSAAQSWKDTPHTSGADARMICANEARVLLEAASAVSLSLMVTSGPYGVEGVWNWHHGTCEPESAGCRGAATYGPGDTRKALGVTAHS